MQLKLAPFNWFKPSSKIFYWPFEGDTTVYRRKGAYLFKTAFPEKMAMQRNNREAIRQNSFVEDADVL